MAAPRWFDIAGEYLGEREVEGPASNPKIIGWATRAGGWIASFFTDDGIPWCALFVNACLKEAGLRGSGSLAARSFLEWGSRLEAPVVGAVLVFGRKGGGHVGFYVGERADAFLVRGGNQGNAVSDAWIAKGRLLGVRWPAELPIPAPGRRFVSGSGATSTNEA